MLFYVWLRIVNGSRLSETKYAATICNNHRKEVLASLFAVVEVYMVFIGDIVAYGIS